MIGDTNLFFNESEQPGSAEAEIMVASVAYRGKRRGWEAMILMLLYGMRFTIRYHFFYLFVFGTFKELFFCQELTN